MNNEVIWRQFSFENNGTYIIEKFDNLDCVENKNYIILFDRYIHYQVIGGQSFDTEFTRVRLEFRAPDNLRFRLTKQGFIDIIGKFFGCQDIEIGDKKFDQRFMIKGNDEVKIHLIFSNNDIKNLLSTQKDILLEILDTKGIFDEPIQDGNVMLYLISETLIVEINQLNLLLKLYQILIDQLTELNSIKPTIKNKP
jgi:hypothetical protein